MTIQATFGRGRETGLLSSLRFIVPSSPFVASVELRFTVALSLATPFCLTRENVKIKFISSFIWHVGSRCLLYSKHRILLTSFQAVKDRMFQCAVNCTMDTGNFSWRYTKWRSQPDIWSCKFFCVYGPF